MKLRLGIVVHGKAVPQGSKKGFLRGKHVVVVDQAKERLEPWREKIANTARRHFEGEIIEGPVKLSVVIVKVRPKSHLTSRGFLSSVGAAIRAQLAPATSPDLGKLERAIEDSLSGVVYRDDSQIVWRDSRKVWGTEERVLIYVIELDCDDGYGDGQSRIESRSYDRSRLYLAITEEEREAANPLTPDEHRALEVQRAG